MALAAEVATLLQLVRSDADDTSRAAALHHLTSCWQQCMRLARRHRLAPLLFVRLRDRVAIAHLRQQQSAELLQLFARSRRITEQQYAALAEILAALAREAIPVMVLKGAYLAEFVYPERAARPMLDLDLLVHEEHGVVARAVLRELGFVAAVADSVTHGHHLPRMFRDRVGVELHTRMWADRGEALPADYPWDRAVPARVGDRDVTVLGIEDQIVFLCSHATHQHLLAQDLRFVVDLTLLVERLGAPLPWPEVIERARLLGRARALALSLALARDLMDCPVPPAVFDQLSTWRPPPEVLDAALRQLLDTPAGAATAQPGFARAWQPGLPLTSRLAEATKQVLLPPARMAAVYGLRRGSPWLPLYYPYRLADLLVRRGKVAFDALLRPGKARAALQRTASLEAWLHGERAGAAVVAEAAR